MKKCSKCGEIKELSEFPFQNKKENKYMSACKVCRSIETKDRRQKKLKEIQGYDRTRYLKHRESRLKAVREYRKRNPEKIRERDLLRKYGITTEQYNEKLKKQNNQCSICERDMKEYGKTFCVDHNHNTGVVRGLLCDPCNYGLGFYEKHKDKYEKYLKTYPN